MKNNNAGFEVGTRSSVYTTRSSSGKKVKIHRYCDTLLNTLLPQSRPAEKNLGISWAIHGLGQTSQVKIESGRVRMSQSIHESSKNLLNRPDP